MIANKTENTRVKLNVAHSEHMTLSAGLAIHLQSREDLAYVRKTMSLEDASVSIPHTHF